ncbi:hypothetical protein SAMN05216556_1312 [Aequorivita viscosa]|uniref:Uncharacterized protein n=1 Tax=Aequorivita viscosa TaxID=797419 RepID=A0A1M6N9K4_9FLAO|nr:hypothetical protein SAMN05216556_1312 [Aequorivita viscosa]SHJ92317.1 hypothetical protein SAMN04487908_13222 [Aequorivita viscosa]
MNEANLYLFSTTAKEQINIDYTHYFSVKFNTVKNKKNYSLGAVRLGSEHKKKKYNIVKK